MPANGGWGCHRRSVGSGCARAGRCASRRWVRVTRCCSSMGRRTQAQLGGPHRSTRRIPMHRARSSRLASGSRSPPARCGTSMRWRRMPTPWSLTLSTPSICRVPTSWRPRAGATSQCGRGRSPRTIRSDRGARLAHRRADGQGTALHEAGCDPGHADDDDEGPGNPEDGEGDAAPDGLARAIQTGSSTAR